MWQARAHLNRVPIVRKDTVICKKCNQKGHYALLCKSGAGVHAIDGGEAQEAREDSIDTGCLEWGSPELNMLEDAEGLREYII